MKKENVFITGANGEVGHGLIQKLSEFKKYRIVALFRENIDPLLKPFVDKVVRADVLNRKLMEKVVREEKIEIIFHLAAVLSTGGEKNPELAHRVNVEGTANLLEIATLESLRRGKAVKFIFPSSIAVYGLPSLAVKKRAGKVKEGEYLNPLTMYGISKLYCENLGVYYSRNYRLLDNFDRKDLIDFRCVRFPGLVSAQTMPSGGTSDYAPEMLHAAAQGKNYECFVQSDRKIPFMAMPDGVAALIKLLNAPKKKLTRYVYNIAGFAVSAKDIARAVNKNYPKSKITYKANLKRQAIIDSWPEDVDDTLARKDWDWRPEYDFNKAFKDYLMPGVASKYR